MGAFADRLLIAILAQKTGVDWTFDYRNFDTTTYTDLAGTIPATTGDLVAYIEDQSGNGNHALRAEEASRMKLAATPTRLLVETSKNAFVTAPAGGWQGHMTVANVEGVATYRVNIPEGGYRIGRNSQNHAFGGFNLIGQSFADRLLSPAEIAEAEADFIAKGAAAVFSGDVINFWRHRREISEFPILNFSLVTGVVASWFDCTGLISFPMLNFSSVTIANSAWQSCIKLANFPSGFFNGCPCNQFSNAFTSTNLTQESIDGILVSINSNGTSNGTFDQSGGSAPSATGQAAIDAMRARGWTITVTGGY